MVEPITLGMAIGYLVKSAPGWFHDLEDMLLGKGKEFAVSQGKQQFLAFLDKKKHLRHVELALKNAAERGLKEFHTLEERDRYRSILKILSDSQDMRHEAMQLFTLSDNPDLTALTEKYNLSQRISSLAQHKTYEEIDATPYLRGFFDALIAELYNDPLFRENMSDVLQVRTAFKGQRSLEEIVAILRDISENLTKGYTLQEFGQEVNAYIEYIESTFRYHEFVGIALKGDEDTAPEIDSIFVPLRIALSESMYLRNITRNDIVSVVEQIPYLVLLGGPGSGKSTTTRYLAWAHAAANKASDSTPPSINRHLLSGKPVPLRIELRRLSDVRRQHPGCSFLTYATDILLAQENISIHPQMFQELLERRAMLLLYDGLDEVPTLAERRQLISEIERFASRYPGNRIVVTSRPVGYDTASFSNRWFRHCKILEFDDEQIHKFLEGWYTYVLKHTSLSSDIRRELEAFYTTLKENVRLHKLATNPLLLTVMTAIHRYERLPDKRVQVYERCADLLLDKWAKLKGVDVRWKDLKMGKEDQSACIAHLGFVLHERSRRKEEEDSSIDMDFLPFGENTATDVSANFMRREIVRYIKNQNLLSSGAEQNSEAERFLDLVKIEAGLIVERGTDENGEALYGFVHRTFQEYFAATHIYGRYQDEGATVISDFLQKHLHDPHWHEVILLLLGKLRRKPATIQLQQILEGNSLLSTYTNVVQQDLFFVCECLAEDINIENDFAEHIVTLVCNLIKKSPYPSQRKQAIQALGAFIRTRQYADLGWQKLQTFLTEESILDIPTIIDAIGLLLKSLVEAEDRLRAIQLFLDLRYHPKISLEQMIQIAEALYRCSLLGSEEQRQSGQLLIACAQRAELTIDHVIRIARTLTQYDSSGSQEQQAIQQLISHAQQPNLSLEELIQVSQSLYQYISSWSQGQRLATQLLLPYIQLRKLSVNQFTKTVRTLFLYSPFQSKVQQQLVKLLLNCAQQPQLPTEELIRVAQTLYQYNLPGSKKQRQAVQLLVARAQQPQLPTEELIRVAQTLLYQYNLPGSKKQRQAVQLLVARAQQPQLSTEELIQIAQTLFVYGPSNLEKHLQATHLLVARAQQPQLSTEELTQIVQVLYAFRRFGSKGYKKVVKLLLTRIQQPSLSIEELIQVTKTLYHYDSSYKSAGDDEVIKLLLARAQQYDNSVEEFIRLIQTLYQHNSSSRPKEYKLSIQLLLACLRRPELSIEEFIQVAQILYQYESIAWVKEYEQALQLLLAHAEQYGLTLEQVTRKEVTRRTRAPYSPFGLSETLSEMQQRVGQLLLTCTKRSDLSIEQVIRIAQSLYQYPWSQEKVQAAELLLACSQRSDIPFNERISIIQTLYCNSSRNSKERQQAFQVMWQLVQNEDIQIEKRLQIATLPFTLSENNYSERLKAAQKILTLIQEKDAKGYIGKKWQPMAYQTSYSSKASILDIPYIVELVKLEVIPTKIRDEMYQILREMVFQFGKLREASK